MERHNISTVIIGRKATGKSTYACNLAKEYVKANPTKRFLIVDVNGSPAYNEFPLLDESKLRTWKPDAKLRVAKYYNPNHTEMFAAIQNFRNGAILFEDCTKYILPNPSAEIRMYLTDHRMWNVDLFFTFHSLNRVPPFFWEMTAWVVLKKTQDTDIKSFKNRIPNFKDIEKAWNSVMASKDPYITKSVSTLI
jgi:hypothetical protein